MERITKFSTPIALALALVWSLNASAVNAQRLQPIGHYRVVSVDQAGQRIGVSLPDDGPKVKQIWVQIRPHTLVIRRNYYGNGHFEDEYFPYNTIFQVLRRHKGKLVKIQGGRDLNREIKATKIWIPMENRQKAFYKDEYASSMTMSNRFR